MNALILFAHGSVLCGAGEAVEAHAARLRATGEWDAVEIGYLNYSEPRFLDTVAALAARGATRVVVAPYFLVAGYFVRVDLPRVLAEAKAAHPAITFVVADALRHDPGLADALLDAAARARTAERWREPLARAGAACRARAECPLYGTSSCPRVPSPPLAQGALAA
jgi:sirohydrochlorin cobaltochelatase